MPQPPNSVAGRAPFTGLQWLICAVAALGFAFDTYELLMLPLIVGPALADLGQVRPGTPEFNTWIGLLFWIPAIAGGIFGLLGGWLTDRFGRRRVLVWSILLYGFSAFASGFATSVVQLLVLRCATFVGVCVEFVAAVAWLAELFSDPKQREAAIGYTQAFSSIGGVMVTGAYFLTVTYADSLPAIYGGHAPWRYTLMSGVIPALPLMIIRPFLPESPNWAAQRAAGTLRRPSIAELFTPALRRTTIVTTLMVAVAYGVAFGGIQQVPRVVPGLPEVASLPRQAQQQVVSVVQSFQEFGGLAGRFALAFLAVRIVSRRRLLHTFMIPGLIVAPFFFFFAPAEGLTTLQWGMGLVGFLSIAQFSFWGNYLPRVYPTYLRGTGEAFAANIGGRMIGTSAAFIVTQLASSMPGTNPLLQLAYACAVVVTFCYVVGFAASFWLQEPKGEALPE